MSLHAGLLMVGADVRTDIHALFTNFNYRPISSQDVGSLEEALPLLEYPRRDRPATVVHKAVMLVNGWTIILDPEMVMLTEEEACAALAARTGKPVFGMICEGTSGSYGFSYFNPSLQRAFWSSDTEVHDDRGDPLPEEEGVDLSQVFEDDILEIMRRLGVEYSALERATSVAVWELDESHLSSPDGAPPPPAPKGAQRPWWKIW